MIPTAEEYSNNFHFIHRYGQDEGHIDFQAIYNFAISLSKLHVTAALEAAAGKVEFDEEVLIRQSILQAYPLENIK